MKKSTKLVTSCSALPSSPEATLSLYKKTKPDMNDTVLTNNPLLLTDDVNPLPSTNRFEVNSLISRVPGNFKNLLGSTLVFSVFFAPMAHAATYYVATNGSDSNPGTLSSPWRTISKAANTLVAGDTVNIRAGTYKEQVSPKNSGYSGAYITYSAYPGETVTLDASGLNFSWSGIFNLDSRSYIEVSGMRLINSPGFGVYMMNSSNMRILKNYTNNTIYSGILAQDSDTVTIDGNEVSQANNGGGSQESISIAGTQNYIVSNNRVHGGGKEGIDAKGNASNGKIFGNTVYDMARVGIYVDGWDSNTTNIEIYNNTVSNSKAADSGASEDGIRIGAEEGGTASNIKVYNNILYNIAQSGIIVSNWTDGIGGEPKFNTVSIYNNTIYNPGVKTGGGINVQGSQNSGIVIRNNIISQARSFNIQASSGTTISNNQFDGGSTAGSSAITGNPLFVAVANNDFHLQSGSPAINTGTTSGAPTIDFDLKARPQGGQVDIGAFEYGSATPSTADTTAPSAPANLAATASTSSQATLSWGASTDNVAVTGYKIYRNGTEIGSSAVTSFTDATIAAGMTYNYTVKAYDKAGNLSASSNTATVNTSSGSAVNISSYSVANITANSAKINWTTNTPSTGTVSYGTSASNLSSQVSANTAATSQSVQLNGLAGGTAYYYKVSAGSGSVTSSFSTSSSSASITNIARLATVTASSQNSGTSQTASKAIDGVIDGVGGVPGDYSREWATVGGHAGSWLQLNWGSNRQISKVVLYDRPNSDDQITSATLTFSNGSRITVGALNNNGAGVTVNFAPVITNSVRVTATTVSGTTLNIGLAELEVYGI
ncbi:MAG: DUF7402 domain-containing protein [Methylobacter sp.]